MITDEQREARRRSIGASDTPAILGLSSYAGPYSIWLDKMGDRTRRELGRDVDWGNDLEHAIVVRARKDLGVVVEASPETRHRVPDGVLRDASLSYLPMHANLDAWLPDAPSLVIDAFGEDPGPGVCEAKSGLHQDWHELQVAHQMFVTGARWGLIARTFMGAPPEYTLVRWADWREAFVDEVLPRLHAFWTCVETKTPPKPAWSDQVSFAEEMADGDAIELPAAATEWVRRALALTRTVADAKREADALKNRLRIALGTSTVGKLAGTRKRVTWKTNSRNTRVLRLPRSV